MTDYLKRLRGKHLRLLYAQLTAQAEASTSNRIHGPILLLVLIALSLFIAESLVMMLLAVLPPMPPPVEGVVDAVALVALALPILYVFAFRPLVIHIAKRKHLEAQLRQAQKMEALGTLAGGIAHDFNNILGAIIGYSELTMQDVPEGATAHENLKEILKAGFRARDLVERILAFSRRSEKGRQSIRLADAVLDATKFMRATLPATIELRTHIERESGFVMADPTEIHQVLMNLASNAGHAMREKGGVLEVRVQNVAASTRLIKKHPDLKNGPYVRLTVKDTGVGMTPETLARIFDPFFTTKDVGEGTGLGLSVVHGIVKAYGGEVTATSKPEKGTTFAIYLPRHNGKKAAETEGPAIETGRHERILYIDDETALTRMLKRQLSQLGYEVKTMNGSPEALEYFREHPDDFDLVITDQVMPGLKGSELALEIQHIRPDIPIVLTTGFSDTVSKKDALSLGVHEFVEKPFAIAELSTVIRRALDMNGR